MPPMMNALRSGSMAGFATPPGGMPSGPFFNSGPQVMRPQGQPAAQPTQIPPMMQRPPNMNSDGFGDPAGGIDFQSREARMRNAARQQQAGMGAPAMGSPMQSPSMGSMPQMPDMMRSQVVPQFGQPGGAQPQAPSPIAMPPMQSAANYMPSPMARPQQAPNPGNALRQNMGYFGQRHPGATLG